MMSASVYRGESRAIPRWILVLLLVKSAIEMAAMILLDSRSRMRAAVPFWLRLPWEWRPLACLLCLVAVGGLLQFARGKRPLLSGGLAMGALVYLNESQAAFTGNEERMFFVCGATFGGWLFGVFFAHALDRRLGRPSRQALDDELGEAGAAGAFASTYLGAFVSKVWMSGQRWASGASLLSIIVGRHTFSGGFLDRYVEFLIRHPALATFFAVATMVIEATTVLYLVGPRLRMTWGALLFAMHLNIYLLMGVKYFVSMVVALALSFPWPKMIRRLRGLAPVASGVTERPTLAEAEAARAVAMRSSTWIATLLALSVALWWTIHANDSARLWIEPGSHWATSAGNLFAPGSSR
jgi:hypothetical protein